jgi:hypothetical protein
MILESILPPFRRTSKFNHKFSNCAILHKKVTTCVQVQRGHKIPLRILDSQAGIIGHDKKIYSKIFGAISSMFIDEAIIMVLMAEMEDAGEM